jgi:hypothetical protein
MPKKWPETKRFRVAGHPGSSTLSTNTQLPADSTWDPAGLSPEILLFVRLDLLLQLLAAAFQPFQILFDANQFVFQNLLLLQGSEQVGP